MPRGINDPTVQALLATKYQEGPPSPAFLEMYLRVFTSSGVPFEHPPANTEVQIEKDVESSP